ncbi:MAG TPA: hypothetical protein VHW23_46210 [Kofleriaceae bacterium]|jgi:hypothetical protein|nr:hypothetical protein [Kofleriaceae bacterium]
MALTTGFVQQMKYNPLLHAAFVWLGASSADTVLYYVQITDRDDDPVAMIKTSLIDGLTAAMFTGRSVTLSIDDANPSSIQSATIHPGPELGPDGADSPDDLVVMPRA